MSPVRLSLLAIALVLPACVATAPAGGSDGTAQVRASVEAPLRRAGLSQDCIDTLELPALAQARGILGDRPRTSREVLQQRQRLQTIGRRYCPGPRDGAAAG
jgi:hypothetical protein